jgi:hypothetical protein
MPFSIGFGLPIMETINQKEGTMVSMFKSAFKAVLMALMQSHRADEPKTETKEVEPSPFYGREVGDFYIPDKETVTWLALMALQRGAVTLIETSALEVAMTRGFWTWKIQGVWRRILQSNGLGEKPADEAVVVAFMHSVRRGFREAAASVALEDNGEGKGVYSQSSEAARRLIEGR